YIEGQEFEVDCISDKTTTYVPVIMEQIEAAGVHSGDSTMILPPVSASADLQDEIERIAQTIGQHLDYQGAFNIQFVVKDQTIYVLEINPRASRTLPIVSKVTGQPLLEWAVQAAIGMQVDALPTARLTLPFHAVKTPVFSTLKLRGVDPMTGPVMRSTGETLQWTEAGFAKERFVFDQTTKAAMSKRTRRICGAGTHTWSDGEELEQDTEFDTCLVFFSKAEEERIQREKALAQGAIVITEEHLAHYFESVQAIPMCTVKRLAEWTKQKEPIQ
ncbi:MAG TPA: carbamoyl-phosphate synthase large subunit, partial [Exiguobacterium sp.]|nr:carbamoyl-phosphate synthase large subunit [Exiguobacterium sp.]